MFLRGRRKNLGLQEEEGHEGGSWLEVAKSQERGRARRKRKKKSGQTGETL